MSFASVDVETLAAKLGEARRVLITTHVRPDGDALGTSAAVALVLRSRGIHAEVMLLSKLPSKYAFVFDELGVVHSQPNPLPEPQWFATFDLLFVVDTGTWSQLPGLEQAMTRTPMRTLVMDHHKTQEPWGEARWVDTRAAAAGEMARSLAAAMGVDLTREIATAIWVAIVSDTGFFQFSNTTPATMRLGAELMEAGVDTDRIQQLLNQNERLPRLMLQRRALDSLRIEAGGKLAVMTIRRADFVELGAAVPDTENLVNMPLIVRDVQASLIAVEPPEGGPVRLSLRSKGGLDCAKFAEQFQGGGHARAAGLKLEGDLESVTSRVVAALGHALQ